MSKRIARLAAAALALPIAAVHAYPEGAPWGSADPDAAENCSSCHYDYDPVRESPALSIDGLPETIEPGQAYALTIRLAGTDAVVSGFQLLAASSAQDTGYFTSDDDTIETFGASSRSIEPRSPDAGWSLTWRAADLADEPIRLLLAASAANDDQSPFGDTIHYRRFVICPAR